MSLSLPGGQKPWFVKQLQLDAGFLCKLGVQDYSLLVAYHPLHRDEKGQGMADVVLRVKQYVFNIQGMVILSK